MNPKTDKLLQQAGKYIALGKLTLALEQYLKIQESEPDDTTIVNTIGDLYVRLDDKDNALVVVSQIGRGFRISRIAFERDGDLSEDSKALSEEP